MHDAAVDVGEAVPLRQVCNTKHASAMFADLRIGCERDHGTAEITGRLGTRERRALTPVRLVRVVAHQHELRAHPPRRHRE